MIKIKDNVSIYPNPVKDMIHIKVAGKIDRADVYNKVGQRVAVFNSVEGKIDVSSLPSGNYILQILVKGEVSQNFKFIKQ